MITITTAGSFKSANGVAGFSAQEHGHAHAVKEAVSHLVDVVLPEAIALDHECQEAGSYPDDGFRVKE